MKYRPSNIHHWLRTISLSLPILITLVGCQSAASTPLLTAAPTTEMANMSTPNVPPTQMITPTQVWTPSPTETSEPTGQPSPTLTPKSPPYTVEEFPLVQKGPWLLFLASEPSEESRLGSQYLWAINQDGTWLTKLVREPVGYFAVQPGGTSEGGAVVAYTIGSSLKIMEFPSGRVTTITDSVSGSLKWSPGGSLLAFVGSLNDDTGDVYIYDYGGGTITRLSDHPGEVSNLNWSPDGAYLVYEADEDIWSVKSDGSNPLLLIEQSEEAGSSHFYGWLDEGKIIFWDGEHQYTGIRIMYVDTGDSATIVEEPFQYAAYSKEHNTWLLSQSFDAEPDTPLILYQYGRRTEIPGRGIHSIWWSSEYDVFFGHAAADGALYTITPDGEITRLSELFLEGQAVDVTFTPSPDGKWWSWSYSWESSYGFGFPGVAIGAAWSAPTPVVSVSPMEFIWSPDSQYLITLDNFSLFIAQPPDFYVIPGPSPLCNGERDYWSPWQAAWIP